MKSIDMLQKVEPSCDVVGFCSSSGVADFIIIRAGTASCFFRRLDHSD